MHTLHEDSDTAKRHAVLSQSGAGAATESQSGRPSLHSPPLEPPPDPGLVLSAKTVRELPLTLAELFAPQVRVTRDDVRNAAAAFGKTPWTTLAEDSPLPRLKVTPGALIMTRKSARQTVREFELAQQRSWATVKAAALFLRDDPAWRPNGPPGREVREWSGKSRANMVKTLASLDWSPLYAFGRVTAMVTLTYPADWETVAPDGMTAKAHFRAWRHRYRRAWGEPLVCAWKQEFQARGAVHFHLFMSPPHGRAGAGRRRSAVGDGLTFHRWLSVVWADVVNHPDPAEYQKHLVAGTGVDYAEALKCSDPKRLAVYFGKHGMYRDKEYQNRVPEAWSAPGKGPGRFWGYCGLKPLAAVAEMTADNYILAARILRRHAAYQQVKDRETGEWKRVRAMNPAKVRWKDVNMSTGEVVWRKRRRRGRARRLTSGSGFLLVNDAPALAHQLARAIEVCGSRQ